MCGIVGIAGDLAHKDEAAIRRLLILDYFRGTDSTGFAAVRNSQSEIKIAKIASNPLDLFDMGRFKDALSGYNSKVFLGHNRAATRGVVNNYNAHPFEFDGIVGVHNGTLEIQSHRELERLMDEEDDLDSRLLIKAIAKMGVSKVIPHLYGAWSLVWYDQKDDSINFLRNKERPMWYAFTEDFKRMLWASEHAMIRACIELGNSADYKLHTEKEGERNFGYFSTNEDTHYKFYVQELRLGGKKRPKAKVKEVKGKVRPTYTPSTNYGWTPGGSPGNDPFKRRGGTPTGKGGVSDTDENVRHIFTYETDPYAGFISKGDFLDLSKSGCSWCQNKLKWGDFVSIHERSGSILCQECSPSKGLHSRIFVPNIANPPLLTVVHH